MQAELSIWYNKRVAFIIVGSRGKKHEVSLRSLLYGIMIEKRLVYREQQKKVVL